MLRIITSDDPVFSTSVEVFLSEAFKLDGAQRLLHVRGGVSSGVGLLDKEKESSPRPWRCFCRCG